MSGTRYRIISTRMWADAKFRALSPAQPSGQTLWIYLLCGPHTGPIPGLFSATAQDMAARLRWTPEAFGEAFGEASHQGMAEASWKDDLVWLPNALAHNPPQSPNVVRSWRSALQELPECELRDRAMDHIGQVLSAHGHSFFRAWQEVIAGVKRVQAKPSGKPLPKASGKTCPNQDQDQEQEQEKEKEKGNTTPPPPATLESPPVASTADEGPEGGSSRPEPASARPKKSDRGTVDKPISDASALPAWVPEKEWAEFVEMRKAKHAPLTAGAIRLTLAKLAEIRNEFGHSPAHVLEQSVQRGWTGVFTLKSDFLASASPRSGPTVPGLSRVGQASVSAAQRWLARHETATATTGVQRDD